MEKQMKRVLVAGASGYLGAFVVRELKERGYRVRVLTRDRGRIAGLGDAADEIVVGEVTDAASLHGICDGVDYVFSSVGITRQKDGCTYMDVDYRGNMNLLHEAQHAGVRKFVYVSVFLAREMAHLQGVRAKLRFEDMLRHAGVQYTIVSPNGFYSDMEEFLRMAEKGRVYLFGDGNQRINPIHGADLAEVCADALEQNAKEVEVGGPDVLTHREIAARAFDAAGKKPRITCIPLWTVRLLLPLLRAFTSVQVYGPLEFFLTVMSRDLIAPVCGRRPLAQFFRTLCSTENGENGIIPEKQIPKKNDRKAVSAARSVR